MKKKKDIDCLFKDEKSHECCNSHDASSWEQLFNASQDPILVVRPDGIIVEANDATLQAARKTRNEVIGQGICKIVHGGRWPHIKCPLEEFLMTCTPKVEETRLPGLFGEYSFAISPVKGMDGKVDRIMLIARELTRDEIRKVDSIRTAKLAAIGELAAGVAHEVNNPVTGIINFAQVLLDKYTFDAAGIDIVQKIIKEGNRIASITHNLISFSRADSGARKPVNPVEIVKESLALVQHQLQKDGIMVVTDFPEKDFFIVADFRQLQQVLLNLISNSRYALNARYPGFDSKKNIEISCFEKQVDGHRVCHITVKDYGTGLPQSILERLFEPFFTTKPPGKGTGLGLSISYGIIKDHGGDLRVNSVLEKYTEMLIELPSGI
ncbi:MAG: PAS domain-containing protein [Desulfobulbaceae bacterium]|uniref:histidine kinase n=1 Tax=Candidatus Desulfobia pelagia TaxID=2841692 RepID=A0A8J6NCF7_9BACT|nr:PAS domain-containing protein [Candidatus Desulfobia pelagia]